jgi:hypothetical protein
MGGNSLHACIPFRPALRFAPLVSNPTDEAPNSCFCPSHYWGFDQEQQLGAFSLVELTGAFIQPLRM